MRRQRRGALNAAPPAGIGGITVDRRHGIEARQQTEDGAIPSPVTSMTAPIDPEKPPPQRR
jgi:hypothetical protein